MDSDIKNMFEEIVELSHEFGTDDYVKGGGGNTSAKNEDTLWVKPSGISLDKIKPDDFLALDRELVGDVYKIEPPDDVNAREAMVKNVMQKSVRPGQDGRPSVEAPLHNVFEARYVVHDHPVLVNGMTCAVNGEAVCNELFPDALWVDFIDPGYTLCMRLKEEIEKYAEQYGHQPESIFLKNHGLFVAADTAERVREIHGNIMDTMREQYDVAGIPMTLLEEQESDDMLPTAERIKELLGDDAGHVCGHAPFKVATGPITPDHIVYSKSYAFIAEPEKDALEAFKGKHGYSPRVISCKAGVFGVGVDEKTAALALELAIDGAEIVQVAEAFGGIEYMTEEAADFIDNWEVEAYRRGVTRDR